MAHLLIHSFEKFIASLPYMPGTAKALENTVINKTNKVPVLMD